MRVNVLVFPKDGIRKLYFVPYFPQKAAYHILYNVCGDLLAPNLLNY